MENTVSKAFKIKVSPEIMKWLVYHRQTKGSSNQNIPSKATEFYYDYCVHRQSFLMNILEINYDLCKKLLRKVGRFITLK